LKVGVIISLGIKPFQVVVLNEWICWNTCIVHVYVCIKHYLSYKCWLLQRETSFHMTYKTHCIRSVMQGITRFNFVCIALTYIHVLYSLSTTNNTTLHSPKRGSLRLVEEPLEFLKVFENLKKHFNKRRFFRQLFNLKCSVKGSLCVDGKWYSKIYKNVSIYNCATRIHITIWSRSDCCYLLQYFIQFVYVKYEVIIQPS
jgi:hypothetical protein